MAKIQEIVKKAGVKRYSLYTIVIPPVMIKKKKWKKGTELIPSFNERGNLEYEEV